MASRVGRREFLAQATSAALGATQLTASGGPTFKQEPASTTTSASSATFKHVRETMALYPTPLFPGVELSWHMDRAVTYMLNVLDRRRDYLPFYFNRVYKGPARVKHFHWDAPHCVGRFLHTMMFWEGATGARLADQAAVDQLRGLLFRCVSDQDNLSHHHPLTGTDSLDLHSQRETLLALLGLARVRGDQESADLARRLVRGLAAAVRSHSPAPGWSGRAIRALLGYHRFSGDSLGVEVAQQVAEEMLPLFGEDGSLPLGHTHSNLGTLTGLIDYGLYTSQARFVERMKRVLDRGVWEVRSRYGAVLEHHWQGTPSEERLRRLLGRCEANSSADVVQAEILLALHGCSEYFDDVERILRNHLLASQYLDPTITTGPTAAEARAVDSDVEVYTDAARRACGGFSFTLPNDLIHPGEADEVDVAADMASGVMDGILEAWKTVVTRSEGALRVNLLFSKDTPELEVRSHVPARGRVELRIKQPSDLYVRIPRSVPLEDLNVTVNSHPLQKRVFDQYLLIPKQPVPATATIEFDQRRRTEDETFAGTTFCIKWLGDTVENVEPSGERVPLYRPSRLALYGLM